MYQFKKELVIDDIEASNYVEAIRELGKCLVKNKVSDNAYINEVLERELIYPTGLKTRNGTVAIPHATSNNVYENEIAVGRLKDTVIFRSMENPDEDLAVKFIFLISIKSETEQTSMLKMLMKLFMNEDIMGKIKSSKNKDEMMDYLNY